MMTDAVDRANDLAEREREAAVARLTKSSPLQHRDGTGCIDCGEDIGAERMARLPGALKCVGCAEIDEARARHFAR